MGISKGPLYYGAGNVVTCTYFASSDPQISGRNYLYVGGRYYPAVSGYGSALRVGSLGFPQVTPNVYMCYTSCYRSATCFRWKQICVWLTDNYFGNSLTFANTNVLVQFYRSCNSTYYDLGWIYAGSTYFYYSGCTCCDCTACWGHNGQSSIRAKTYNASTGAGPYADVGWSLAACGSNIQQTVTGIQGGARGIGNSFY